MMRKRKVGDGKSVSDEVGTEAGSVRMTLRSMKSVGDGGDGIQQRNSKPFLLIRPGKKNKTQSTSKSSSQAAEKTLGDVSSEMPLPFNGNDMCKQLTTCYCCNYQGKIDNNKLVEFNQHNNNILQFDQDCSEGNLQYPNPLHQDIIALPNGLKEKLYKHNKFVIEVSLTNQYLDKFKDDLSMMDPPSDVLKIVVCCAFLHKRLSPRKNINLYNLKPDDNAGFNKVIYAIIQHCEGGTVVRGSKYLEAYWNYWENANEPKLSDLQGKLPEIKKPGNFNILFHVKHQLINQNNKNDATTMFKNWMCGEVTTPNDKKRFFSMYQLRDEKGVKLISGSDIKTICKKLVQAIYHSYQNHSQTSNLDDLSCVITLHGSMLNDVMKCAGECFNKIENDKQLKDKLQYFFDRFLYTIIIRIRSLKWIPAYCNPEEWFKSHAKAKGEKKARNGKQVRGGDVVVLDGECVPFEDEHGFYLEYDERILQWTYHEYYPKDDDKKYRVQKGDLRKIFEKPYFSALSESRIRYVKIIDISKDLRSGGPPVEFQYIEENQYTDMYMRGFLPGDKDIKIISKETKKAYDRFSCMGAEVDVCFEEDGKDKWVPLKDCYLVVPGRRKQDELSES